MKHYYLAYGSNLNLDSMKHRCPNSIPIGTYNLYGYRLVYKGIYNYSYLTIEEDKDSYVPLGLFQLSISDIRRLDHYEGFPYFYSKVYLPISINGKNKKALIYVMNEDFEYNLPSKNYVNTCMEGYNYFGFDKEILKKAYKDTYDNLNKSKTFNYK